MERIAILSACFLAFAVQVGCSKATSSEKKESKVQSDADAKSKLKTTSQASSKPDPAIAKSLKFVAATDVIGDWLCVTEQEVMKLKLEESFGENGDASTEGVIEFVVPNGPSLNIYIKSESRWTVKESKLCDTPVEMALTQTSGAPNPLVDQLLTGMRKQAKTRIDGKLTTCRAMTEVTPSSMVLKTLDSAIETKCKRKVKTP